MGSEMCIRDRQCERPGKAGKKFLSTPSARRATKAAERMGIPYEISIHALREEGDLYCVRWNGPNQQFLSTPSARRATRFCRRASESGTISIHALREEGDSARLLSQTRQRNFYPRPPRGGRLHQRAASPLRSQFLSTPSARRATDVNENIYKPHHISIHALREEGDRLLHRGTAWRRNFYPRPPRGGRHCTEHGHNPAGRISIHALREEGDSPTPTRASPSTTFLSTPSARRATAKTETKSLFSYKLYNILHEFRRALIYNGSKNYPNHAKRLENPVRRCRKDAENSPFAPGRKTQNNSRPSCSKGG